MRALVSVMPFAGHVAPVSGVVEQLIAQGHEVTVYTGSRYRSRFEALGATVVSWTTPRDFDEHDIAATFPGTGQPGMRGLMLNMEHVFIRTASGQSTDLVAELGAHHYDVLIGDVMSLGSRFAADLTRIPWVTVSVVPLLTSSVDLPPSGVHLHPGRGALGHLRDALLRGVFAAVSAPFDRIYREVRRSVGLPDDVRRLTDGWYSPTLVLATGSAGIEYPRSDLPAHFHFVGRIAPAGSAPVEIAPADAPRQPLVVVTQGTFNTDAAELLVPTVTALADREVRVVATTGIAGITDIGIPVPANATIVDFARFGELLPEATVFVSNGGWGGVLEVLSAGVPLVVAGGDLDKPEIAARVGWSKAGIDVRTGRPKPASVARAVHRILADPSYRMHAQRLAREIRALGGAGAAVDHIEALIERPETSVR